MPITVLARVKQPLASVASNVYVVPAQSPVAAEVLPPAGAHAYVEAPVAPVKVTVAPPLHAAVQEALVFKRVMVTVGVLAIVTTVELAQATLYESVTVAVYVPGQRPVIEVVVDPVDHAYI